MNNKKCFGIFILFVVTAVPFFVLIACGGGGGGADLVYHPTQPADLATTQPTLQVGDSKEAFEAFVTDLKNANTTGLQTRFETVAWASGMSDIVLSSGTDLAALGILFDNATLEAETDEAAYYIARRTENGVPITYHVQMVKVNGVWKVASM